jgi:hypothetical protein
LRATAAARAGAKVSRGCSRPSQPIIAQRPQLLWRARWPRLHRRLAPRPRSAGARAAGGVKQSTFCMARRKTMITMGSPYFVWKNTNEIILLRFLRDSVCVAPPRAARRCTSSSAG